MNIFKKSLAFVSTAALLGATFAPGVAAQGTDIANNGALSTNTVTQSNSQTNTTVQNNTANFSNTVDVTSNTGGNTADYNTGGNVGIGTGNSVTGVQINNMANLNVANTSPTTGATNPELPVIVQGNGAASANTFDSTNTQDKSLYQTNTANLSNSVATDSNTGNNTADFGTNGNTTILTGQSQTAVGIQNTANGNVVTGNNILKPTSLTTLGTGTDILNNGALSANTVDMSNTDTSLVEQTNTSDIANAVTATTNTGTNTSDYNTGGSQLIGTGTTKVSTGITNMANFNSVSMPADNWMNGSDPLLFGNGAASANAVDLSQTKDNALYQTNDQTASNALTFDTSTGLNTADYNTLPRTGITETMSGPSTSTAAVSNQGNVNTTGNSTLGSIGLPGGMTLNLGFSLGQLLGL